MFRVIKEQAIASIAFHAYIFQRRHAFEIISRVRKSQTMPTPATLCCPLPYAASVRTDFHKHHTAIVSTITQRPSDDSKRQARILMHQDPARKFYRRQRISKEKPPFSAKPLPASAIMYTEQPCPSFAADVSQRRPDPASRQYSQPQ